MLSKLELSKILRNLPQKPGVYRFYTKDDRVLYIGKAKNLKNRVSSYFQDGRPKNQRLTLMISQIDKIEYTVVKTEKESLILEANLIHQLQPKYNVLLKDDRSYLYVRFTQHPIPGIFLTRKKFDPNSQYFGPYTKKTGIYQTLRTLRTIFPFCQERYPQKKPCSYVGIKQCDGICIGKEKKEDYLQKIEQIKKVLSGKTEQTEDFIKQKMQNAIAIQNYELAALWRDRLKTLKETIVDQKIVLPHPQDLDLISLILEENSDGLLIGSIFLQNIREGKVINVNNFLLTSTKTITEQNTKNDWKEISQSFLQRFMASHYNSQEIDNSPVLVESFLNNKIEK